MAVAASYLPKPWCTPKIPIPPTSRSSSSPSGKLLICDIMGKPQSIAKAGAVGAGVLQLLTFVEPALSLQLPLQLHEPPNALSLPTWAIHISSVVEWSVTLTPHLFLFFHPLSFIIMHFALHFACFFIVDFSIGRVIAMALVWQYGDKSGYEAWKGLSWGMVSEFSLFCNFLAFIIIIPLPFLARTVLR